jgi:hypothetical protein
MGMGMQTPSQPHIIIKISFTKTTLILAPKRIESYNNN